MPGIYGQLQAASLENLSSDPASSTAGRVHFNTTSTKMILDDGTLKRAMLRNDQNCVFGNNATAANNIRLNRAANSVLQFVTGGDTTAEGTLSTALAQLSARQENYTTVGRPAAGNFGRLYYDTTLNSMFYDNGTKWLPMGGGAGGGSAVWEPVDGLAPTGVVEFNEKAFAFEKAAGQALTLAIRVPSGYVSGNPITLQGLFYCAGTTNNWKMTGTTTLIRKGTDAISSTTNQRTTTNGDVANGVTNLLQEVSFDVSSTTGTINSVAVSPGDLLIVQVTRVTPTGTEDTNDVKFIPSSTEVSFS
jgi:hypothetical protein